MGYKKFVTKIFPTKENDYRGPLPPKLRRRQGNFLKLICDMSLRDICAYADMARVITVLSSAVIRRGLDQHPTTLFHSKSSKRGRKHRAGPNIHFASVFEFRSWPLGQQ